MWGMAEKKHTQKFIKHLKPQSKGGSVKSTEVGKARSKFGGWLGAPIIQFNHAKCPFTWGGVNYYSPPLLLPPSPFHQAMTKFLSRAEANEVICMHDNCYCIFFGARANIKIDKMPSNGNETTLPPSPPPLTEFAHKSNYPFTSESCGSEIYASGRHKKL